jgi:hypothetical protein
MALPGIQPLAEARCSTTKSILSDWSTLITQTIAEVKAVYGFENKGEEEMSHLEQSYLADRTAVAILSFALDRFKEDLKAKLGADSTVHEEQDKLQFLKEQISRFEKDAEYKRARLGLDIVTPPAPVANIPAAEETE